VGRTRADPLGEDLGDLLGGATGCDHHSSILQSSSRIALLYVVLLAGRGAFGAFWICRPAYQ